MRQRKTITIRRDDHLDDALGAVFFEPAEGNEQAILDRLHAYLGRYLTVIKADIESRRIVVEVQAQCFNEESERIVTEAANIWDSGGRRAAVALIQDAVRLDPFNQRATIVLASFLIDQGAPGEALPILKRARELGPDSADVLRNLARACLAMERRSSAVMYLKEAVKIAPRDFQSLRMLDQLGYRKPKAEPPEGEGAPPHRRNARTKSN
ncbi:MAG: tetratricopeptide repeat protein [Candidatus Binataceae bacterium]|nr:tetratricopeptide repeat protein [Candidatus Binataceae bacterium]